MQSDLSSVYYPEARWGEQVDLLFETDKHSSGRPHFALRGPKEAAEVIRNSGALVVLDPRRGYRQVAMTREARDFLGARFEGRTVASTYHHLASP